MINPITNEENLIHEFTKETLLELIQADRSDVIDGTKKQVDYLARYLERLGCKSIVVEEKYIDKNFFDDYIHFYGTCYRDYSRICQRFHFFKIAIKIESILNLDSKFNKLLQANYLGFSIIKPIPNLIGRTVIKVLDDTNCNPEHGFKPECRHILTLRKSNE